MKEKSLRETLAKLPTIMSGTVAKDNEIIEGNEEGCHYKITKETVPVLRFTVYMISISGPIKNRRGLIRKFKEILGQSQGQFRIRGLDSVSYIFWDANKIDARNVR